MVQKAAKGILFHAVERRRFGTSTCFLCGRRLGSRNRADEHIIPKWVQERFALWDQKLSLLNDTTIPYRKLQIPCCRRCNNDHLQPIESKISSAVDQGPQAVGALDHLTLFLWLGKIFYGLLYKEFFLQRKRKSKRRRRIVPRSSLQEFSMHHLLLQAARVPFQFHPALPASIFVFRVQAPKNRQFQWNLRDSYTLMTMSVTLGNVGILAALQDGGAQRDLESDFLQRYQQHPLHPLQFAELTAAFFYKTSLLNRVPKFIVGESEGQPVQVMQAPLAGLTSKPIFDGWKQKDYAVWLAEIVQVPLERVFVPPNRVMTWVHDDNGNLRLLDFKTQPWPARAMGPYPSP